MIKQIEGIVTSEIAYKDTSKIINVLTKEDGVLSFLAKGARSLKSDLRRGTTKLTRASFTVYYKENGLSTLTSVDVINSFKEINKDLEKISYAIVLVDLAEQVMKQRISSNIYELLIQGLEKINEGYNPLVIMNIVELKYLKHLGVMPVVDECAVCGNKTNIVTLSCSKGGYICNNCHTNERIINEKSLKLIRMYYYVDISKISKLDVKDELEREINSFIDEYYDTYTGLYLRTKTFLKNLNKISQK